MLSLERLEQNWTRGEEDVFNIYRAKIPGGWLVLMQQFDYRMGNSGGHGWGYGGATFVPDPDHKWDGSSLPNI